MATDTKDHVRQVKEQKKLQPATQQEIEWIVRKFNEKNKLRRPGE